MAEILEKEEYLITARTAWYRHADRSRRDPQILRQYFKRDHTCEAYHVKYRVPNIPKFWGEKTFFRREIRRKSFGSQKPMTAASTGYVPIETVQTFIELLQLPGGWNSYNAKQIRKENVGVALSLLDRVMRPGTPAPIVVPTVRGGVQLEWHTKAINLEIAIDSADDITFFAEDLRNTEEPEQVVDESTLPRWIERISAR